MLFGVTPTRLKSSNFVSYKHAEPDPRAYLPIETSHEKSGPDERQTARLVYLTSMRQFAKMGKNKTPLDVVDAAVFLILNWFLH